MTPDSTPRLVAATEAAAAAASGKPAAPAMNDEDRHQILVEWNQTQRDYPRDKCVHHLFEDQVERTPEAVAVVFEDTSLTYRELNARANQFAHHLRALGVGPEVLVGLCVERSLEMAIGLLGILKAGAAYVPLDPGFPPERLAFMARDSAMPVLVTQRSVADSLPAGPAQTVWLDNFQWQELAPNLQLTLSPDALAYVIYTSGSTGQPKGVEISQRALVNCLCHFQHSLGVGPADVWLAVTTLSFDIAGLELFLPLIAGASVAIASRATAMDPHLLSHALRRHGATILQATPAGWQLLLHSGWQGNPQLQILCGGEAMPRALAESLARLGSRAWNVYGPTETTIWSTAHPLVPGNPVNIGKPLANTRIYVLDAAGQPAPIGVPGDLLIGGDGLARGYRNQPDLTSERFIADPFSTQPAARCYKTGDRARWLTDGSLEFLGRNDLQVKIRGFRIEPGEIEAVLAGHPGLAASAVVAQCHNDGDKALAAFVVGSGQAVPTVESLRQWLATKLPDHMIPSRFFPLPVLPLTPNGKLDRKALEQMNGEALTTDTQHVAARSELECELVAIWQSVLRRERVGIHDNFFTLGGHSLVAVAICSQIIRQLAREVPLRWLFEHPTIAQLAEQIQSLGAHPPDAGPIIRADRSQPLPMSFAQQGMWLLHQTLADPATYNESLAWQFSGKVDRQCCRRAVQVIHERHEVLRTALLQQGEQLVQQVGTTDEVPLPWHEVDLQTQPPESQPEALTDLLLDNARRPFDLAQPPLWRALWIQLSPGEQVLQLTFHHSIIDEWSMRRLCAELEQLYAADGQTELAGLPDLPLQYADYAAWQRQRLCGDLLEQQRQYWDGQLRDLPPALELPGDFPRPARPSGRGAIHAFQLTTPLVSQLRDLARAEGCTLFALVLAAFHVWLHRYTGEADVVVCTPVANRLRPEIDSLLGLFINTLPIRLRMDGNPAFREVLGQARHSLMEAFSHAELPFEQMAAMATAGRDPGQLTLYQVMFVLLEEGLTELKIAGAQARQLPVTTRTSKNDLTLFIAAEGDSWECHFEYALDLFTADTAARMGRHFSELLNSIAADPSLSISQLNLMPAAERHQIQVEWNQTQRDYPRDKCVHHLFEEQVARNPEAVAVVFEDTSLTYSELNARANQLAHHLRALGVGPEVLVGLCVERSEVVAIALLAVLKAGGALVPIDPTLPPERIGFIMADARIPWLLTRSFLLDKLPPTNTQLLCLDRDWGPTSTAAPGVVSAVGAQPLNLAYAIYTSGSTGRPKGVLLPHDAYVNYCAAAIAHWQYLASDRVLQFANFSFDVSIDQLVTPLLAGATVVIRGTEIWDPAIFSDIIRKHRLTVVHTPPIYWQEWVNTLTKENCRDSLGTLRLVQVGGDVMPLPTVRRWRELELHSVRLFNRYGPTETTMFSTAYEVTATNPLGDGMTRIPIGRPVGPRQLHILDAHGMPVPVGIPGEIHIGGPTLARGYLNRAELTAERFIPDPFSTEPGARLYKTGDWGRFLPDGNIDFIGRIDFQVKIRGFRIELGEIETALAGHPELTSCAVVVQCRDGGDKSLAAFVAGSAQAAPTVDALRQWLAAKLPDYMIPSRFFVLPTLPLTPNGKVDRKALEQMGGEELTIGTEHVAARTDMERQLVEIWQIVLRREQVGIHDDFFTLGGHSLLAVAICSRLTRRIEREVPLRWLFEHPTIAQLAVQIQSLDAQLRDASPITRADRSQPLPMSFAQQGMWLLQQTLADPATYNQPVAWHLSGKVDPQRCRRSLQTIHERHEVLRSALLLQGDELVQQVGSADELPLPWLEIDLQTLPPETQADALAGHLLDEARRPFDLAQPPLWRAAWARLASDQQVLQLTFHHSIIDEWSKRQLFAELQQLYAADGQPVLAGHPELPLQYADYAVWQRQRLSGDQLEQQRQYWAGQLRDLPPALELPGDFPRPAHPSGRGASHAFQITAPLVTRLRDLARAEGCTVFTLILAAFHVWLHRYTGEPDVVVGTPVANRLRPEIESLVGFFLNTLPLRLRMDGNPAFRDVLAQARHSLMQAFSHAELPFEQMVAMAPAGRDPGQQAIYQVMFVLLEEGLTELKIAGAQARQLPVTTRTSKNDLTLFIAAEGDSWECHFEYALDLFTADTAARMGRHFAELLNSITADPSLSISQLDLMPAAERHQIQVEWNQTQRDYPRDKCVHHLFEEQVARNPEAVAVVFEDTSLTYSELNARANQLALHLRSLGVGPEVLVGLCVERSLEMMVAVLGILKSGGAYVPIDPDYPAERVAFMIADAAAPVLVTQSHLVAKLPPHSARLLVIDKHWEDISHLSNANLPNDLSSANIAYVIYTSGSTGRPKGAINTHRGICNRLLWMQEQYQLLPKDVVLQKTPLSFDVSVWELLWALATGARLVVAKPGGHKDAAYLIQLICDQQITILHFVPAMLRAFLAEPTVWRCRSLLRHVFCSGEALAYELQEYFFGNIQAQLHNLYGPTEAAIDVTHWTCRRDNDSRIVPIGRPVANTHCYILNELLEPMPIGFTGQLHLGGVQIGRGYLNRPDLTLEHFIPDPFSHEPDARLYKTGDLARYLPDGNIEFLGRIDHQVKIRGFRIELGEVEAVLGSHPDVAACAVVVQSHNDGDKALAAFVVGSGQAAPTVDALRQWLATKLPEHMIPSRFFVLPALPLTPNGKVDRNALEKTGGVELTTGTEHVAARTELERDLVEIWQAVLRREKVGIDDNFFTLGGHSLLAVAICSRLTRRLGREVPLRWLFEHPSIVRLAEQIQSVDAQLRDASPITRADRSQPLPMSFAQQGMWLLQQTLADPATYNQPVAWHLSGKVDPQRCRRALQVIHERHEVLRSALLLQDEELVQQVGTAGEVPLPWHEVDLQTLPPETQAEALAKLLLDEARRPFDLARPPLWRAAWVQLAADEQVLQLTFHHSIIDEWSMRRLFAELEQLYAADDKAESAGLPDLPLQYADYAAWQKQRLGGDLLEQQRQYWNEQLRDLPPALELPGDFPRPAHPSGRGASHAFQITAPLVTRLRDLARGEGSTLFMLMLAAFHVWLHRYTGEPDVVVGTPVANRLRPEIESLVGFFLNTLPIRLRLDGSPTFREVLIQARHSLMAAFSHAELPFEQMVAMAPAGRAPGQQPIYQVMFVLLEEDLTDLKFVDAQARQLPVTTRTSKNDLTLFIAAVGASWECHFEYAIDLFTADTAARMGRHFAELLNSITADPSLSISKLNLMPTAERHQVMVEWNQTQRDYPHDKCVHHLFEEQVERTPEAVAIVFEDTSLTYRELNARANQLAHHLRALGVGPEVLVGLCVERSLEMAVAVLGILKAGGAYWAIEENLPIERLELMLKDARPLVILANQAGLQHLTDTVTRISIDSPVLISTEGLICPDAAQSWMTETAARADSPAYVSYTSGSTGQPKGVVVPHRGIVRLVKGADYVSLAAGDTILHLSPLSFDASTFEIWGALLNGGKVVMLPPGPPSLAELGAAIRHHGVTTLWLTAGLFHLMVDERTEDLRPIRQLLAGGDVLQPETVRRARHSLPECRIINGYGPTENTTFTCCYQVEIESALTRNIPIGRPIANTRVYILDKLLQPTPIGIAGELHTGGDGLALGYLNRPELTAERFIADPFNPEPGALLYKTGDMARYLPDGNIEFLGRLDHQVKIRGFRIELGEIEVILRSHPALRDARVIAREDSPGDKRLVAYLVAQSEARPDETALHTLLAAKLPSYMLPGAWVWLEQLPLTPNGKMNLKALPKPAHVGASGDSPDNAPTNLLELELVRIWQKLFRRQDIGTHDNFFELGGHSLQAVHLAAAVENLLGCKLPIATLFQAPTVELLARRLTDERWTPAWSSLVPLQPQGPKPPLFLMHGWGGDVYGFVDLARLMDSDQPVYGLQAVGLDGRTARHISIKDMAAHYVEEIRSFQPEGPYFVGGYSMGGQIAYEVAQQLRSLGQSVGLLALMDSGPIGTIPKSIYARNMAAYLSRRCLFHLRHWWQKPNIDRVAYLRGRWAALRIITARNRSKPPQVAATTPAIEAPQVPGFTDYYHALAAAYQLKPYHGPVDIIVGDGDTPERRRFWRYMARGGVSFHRIGGTHLEILTPQRMPVLAQTLAALLRRAQQAAAPPGPPTPPPHANHLS